MCSGLGRNCHVSYGSGTSKSDVEAYNYFNLFLVIQGIKYLSKDNSHRGFYLKDEFRRCCILAKFDFQLSFTVGPDRPCT